MSFKAKDLSYETNLPPFLQRLRNQYGDTSGRLERPIARPRKPKDDNGDDDEPTYVDEESNEVISKEEYAALVRESNQTEDTHTTGSPNDEEKPGQRTDIGGETRAEKEPPTAKQNLAEIGGPRKRKQARVVGEDSAPDNKDKDEPAEPADPAEGTVSQKPKQKKKKKIKLSFDEA